MEPKITVLVPVYNAEKTLRLTIDSILGQTFKDFEFLIIDDGSTDRSVEIVKSYGDPRIRLVLNEKNMKLISTLNRGFELARGQWIARIDSDDIALPGRLQAQWDYLQQNKNVDVLGTWARIIDETGRPQKVLRPPAGRLNSFWIWRPPALIHPTVMIRANVAKANPFDKEALHCEDYELWLRLFKKGHVLANLPLVFLKYRVHENAVTQKFRTQQLSETYRVFKKYYANVEATSDEFLALCGASKMNQSLSFGRRLKLVRQIAGSGVFPPFLVLQQLRAHLLGLFRPAN